MVLGFNHNIRYKGEEFHVQTEDSGVANPHIITLLYRGGVIISSKKTSYADIVKFDGLDAIVEDLMKEQHKEMMRRLKGGEFDEKAFSFTPQLIKNVALPTLESVPSDSGIGQVQPSVVTVPAGAGCPEVVSRPVGPAASVDGALRSFFGPR